MLDRIGASAAPAIAPCSSSAAAAAACRRGSAQRLGARAVPARLSASRPLPDLHTPRTHHTPSALHSGVELVNVISTAGPQHKRGWPTAVPMELSHCVGAWACLRL